METYDVLICGGGIAGSVAAKFSAAHGFRTMLIEKKKTPRNKACSGIQLAYFEKLIGEPIPQEALCQNDLYKVELVAPTGKTVKANMKMFNFWRSTFDRWLNERAADAGAEFYDETELTTFEENEEWINITLTENRKVRTRYLIAADGFRSVIRKTLRHQDVGRPAGGTINYYITGDSTIDPHTLYMFHAREFSPLMFSWVYMKDDKYVIGTGADTNLMEYGEKFLEYIKEKYCIQGEIVKREGFSSSVQNGIYLGKGNILVTGDAAGLVDLYRGMGMDNAALSGRCAVKAVIRAEERGCPAIDVYCNQMKRITSKIEKNAQKQEARYTSNQTLEKSFSPLSLAKEGLAMLLAAQINKILPPERIITLPL